FFHSKREEKGKWGIWWVKIDGSGLERITPEDVDAYTPAVATPPAPGAPFLAAAVRREGHRQIVLINLASHSLTDLTGGATDHWNPSFSRDGLSVAYHQATPDSPTPNVELWGAPPDTALKLIRLAGAFPAFSPDGRRLALTGGGFASLDVMNSDGTDRKTLYPGKSRALFSVSWAHHGDRIAFSHGAVFQGPGGAVDIATV